MPQTPPPRPQTAPQTAAAAPPALPPALTPGLTMAAWQIDSLGQPARQVQIPVPVPGPGQALVRVAAAGLNFADLLMAEGRYQERPALPFTPGLELAGHVAALGTGTAGPAPGTPVAAHVAGGAFAEYALVPVAALVTLPAAMPLTTAAGFLIAYGTSHLALTRGAGMQPGETLLVTGAAGGVGLTAVEIGHVMGARVIATARGAAKAQIARAAGADLVIDSDSPDLAAELKDVGGIDVTYDTVGGAGFDAALRAMRPGGRMLAIGFAGGDVPQVPLNQLLVRNVTVAGFWWGGWMKSDPARVTASLTALMDLWQAGRLSPRVSAVHAFADLATGLAAIRDRSATGKIVLQMPAPAPA